MDAGAFGDAHVELVQGELIEMAPARTRHAFLHGEIMRALVTAYQGSALRFYLDLMVTIEDDTVRTPDIVVAPKVESEGTEVVAADIVLAVEVSQTTLPEDLGRKRVHYAKAGIRSYWVVDGVDDRVHMFAEPIGSDYAQVRLAKFGELLDLPEDGGTITIG